MNEIKVKGFEEGKLMPLTQEQRDYLVGMFDTKGQALTIQYVISVLIDEFGYAETTANNIVRRSLDEGIIYVDQIKDRGTRIFIALTDRGEKLWGNL